MGHIDELVVTKAIADSAELKSIDSNYIRFVSGDYNGLALETKSDANADSGFTFSPNTFHQVAYDGGGASALVLPKATKGTLVVMRFTAAADGGQTQTYTTASGDFYAAQTLNIPTDNNADLTLNPRVIGNDFTDTVAIGTIVTAAATHNTLSIATTATNNITNIGAELSFYCETAGFWRVAFRGSQLGSGAINATFAFTTV